MISVELTDNNRYHKNKLEDKVMRKGYKGLLACLVFVLGVMICRSAWADSEYYQLVDEVTTIGTSYFNIDKGEYLLRVHANTSGGSVYWEVYDTDNTALGWDTIEIFTSTGTYLGTHAGGTNYHYRARLDPSGSNEWIITAEKSR